MIDEEEKTDDTVKVFNKEVADVKEDSVTDTEVKRRETPVERKLEERKKQTELVMI